MLKQEMKLGLAPTRRDVFSREDSLRYKGLIEAKLREWGVSFVNVDWLNEEGLLYDGLDAEHVAERFRAEGVDAVFAPHCNFGTEDAVAKLARGVGKPFLLWGPRDEDPLADGTRLRDTQCGLFATSKVLRRLGVPFTYIVNSRVDSPEFERGFKSFLGAAAAANSFLGARIGQIDTRPSGFWTVMINEGELLERWNIQAVPVSLSDIVRDVRRIVAGGGPELEDATADFKARLNVGKVSHEIVERLAALKLALKAWAERDGLDAIAFQCWSALQDMLGVCPGFVDGELTDMGIPVACETDIHGALTSLMLQAAAGWTTPTFFADLTIRHPHNENSELLWHCGVFPYSLAEPHATPKLDDHYILASSPPGVGEFPIKGGDVTIARFDGDHGEYSMLIGQARGTQGPFTRGTYLWVEMDNWPRWEQKIIYGPYIHHVVGIHGRLAPILHEACRYIPGLKADPVEPGEEEILAYWRGQ